MAKKLSRNAPCPCESGKKYKHCCIGKDFEWIETEDGQIERRIPISDEAFEALESLHDSQRTRFGREPHSLFEGAPPLEHLEHWTVEAMKQGGVDPALIFAYEKTGLLLSDRNENLVPDSDIREWEAALGEYERETGKEPSRRRLNERDFNSLMQNGPSEHRPAEFVSRLPFTPPFDKEEWGRRRMSDIVNEPEYFDYYRRCVSEITKSGRGGSYLNMFLLMTHLGNPPEEEQDFEAILAEALTQDFSIEQLRHSLESILMTFGPKSAAPNAAAAFEFLAFVGDFMTAYSNDNGMTAELNDSIQRVNALALAAFVAAVNVELGVREDAWRP